VDVEAVRRAGRVLDLPYLGVADTDDLVDPPHVHLEPVDVAVAELEPPNAARLIGIRRFELPDRVRGCAPASWSRSAARISSRSNVSSAPLEPALEGVRA